MPKLVFLLSKYGQNVLIAGVKRPEDLLFHLILGDNQLLDNHPHCVQLAALAARGNRTRAVLLDFNEYQIYEQNNRFEFNGHQLRTGKCNCKQVQV